MANIREVELTNIVNGKKTVCRNIRHAESVLGRSTCYIRNRIKHNEHIVDKDGNVFRGKLLNVEFCSKPSSDGKQTRPQLCWKCKKACGKCSWSRSFVPVAGWTAKETKIHNNQTNIISTYLIIDCPQFDEE